MSALSKQKRRNIERLLKELELECGASQRPMLAYLLEMVRLEVDDDGRSTVHGDDDHDSFH